MGHKQRLLSERQPNEVPRKHVHAFRGMIKVHNSGSNTPDSTNVPSTWYVR